MLEYITLLAGLLGLIGYLFDVGLVLLQRRYAPWAGKDA